MRAHLLKISAPKALRATTSRHQIQLHAPPPPEPPPLYNLSPAEIQIPHTTFPFILWNPRSISRLSCYSLVDSLRCLRLNRRDHGDPTWPRQVLRQQPPPASFLHRCQAQLREGRPSCARPRPSTLVGH